jgi:hypothetical protein
MPRIRTLALTAGLAVALASLAPTARGQVPPGAGGAAGGPGMGPGMRFTGPGMGMGMGMGPGGGQSSPLMLLLAPSVQKELKLSDEQKTKVYSFAKTANQKNRDMMQSVAMGGGAANPQAMMEGWMKLRQETDQAISGILDSKQKGRLDEIALRAEGPLAVARPEIAQKVGLNDNQKQYVQEIMMQMRQELMMQIRQAQAAGQFDPSQVRPLAAQLRTGAEQELGKVLDKKQKTAFNKMLGLPFDLKKLDAETAAADAAVPAAGDVPQTKDAPGADKTKDDSPQPADAEKPAAPAAARKKGRAKSGF